MPMVNCCQGCGLLLDLEDMEEVNGEMVCPKCAMSKEEKEDLTEVVEDLKDE